MTENLLDLVRQHARMYAAGVAFEPGSRNAETHLTEAEALFARIAALVPQQPVQARDEFGLALFIHACGHVSPEPTAGIAEGEHHCFPPCKVPGPWLPLYVLDAAPDSAPEVPVFKRHLLMASGTARCGETRPTRTTRVEAEVQCPACLAVMQAESDELTVGDVVPPEQFDEPVRYVEPRPGILREVREALGVGSDAEVLGRVRYLAADLENARGAGKVYRRERDEARAELKDHLDRVSRLAGELNTVEAERDENAEWADRLSQAIAEFLHVDIGEHSNMNLPWQAALTALTDAVSPQPDILALAMEALGVDRAADVLDAIETIRHLADIAERQRNEARAELAAERTEAEALRHMLAEARAEVGRQREAYRAVAAELARRMRQQDGPIVLRLPEVPPGTVALHAVGSTNVYSWPGDDLAQILEAEPEGVTAELAPEPEPRTAAEVWAGMREALRAELGDQGEFGELVDALDREAGL